jgi:lysozyme
MRTVPLSAFDFLSREEGCVLRVYDDARPDYILQPGDKAIGTLTAGRGHTGFICVGDPVSQARADEWTWQDLRTASDRLSRRIGEIVFELTENQFVALLSFADNCGTGNPLKPEWNIWRVLKARQFAQVPLELAKFVNGEIGGKTVKISGLVKRRNDEIELWSKDEPGSIAAVLPSSVTRSIVTPPTPGDPVPASKSKTILIGAVAAVAAMPVAYTQAATALGNAHIATAHPSVIATLSGLSACCAALTVLFAYLHKQANRN